MWKKAAAVVAVSFSAGVIIVWWYERRQEREAARLRDQAARWKKILALAEKHKADQRAQPGYREGYLSFGRGGPFLEQELKDIGPASTSSSLSANFFSATELLIEPPQHRQPSEDDQENARLVEVLKRSYPDRYEDGATRWVCGNCQSTITSKQIHYVCAECDAVLCGACWVNKEQEPIVEVKGPQKVSTFHHHGGVNFFFREALPRMDLKQQLHGIRSSSKLLSQCFCHYQDRAFIGTKRQSGFSWTSFGEVEKQVVALATGLQHIGSVTASPTPLTVIGMCLENRLEW